MSDDEKRKSSPVFERGSWIRVGANALLVIAGIGLAYAMLDAAGDHVSQSLASKVPMPLR